MNVNSYLIQFPVNFTRVRVRVSKVAWQPILSLQQHILCSKEVSMDECPQLIGHCTIMNQSKAIQPIIYSLSGMKVVPKITKSTTQPILVLFQPLYTEEFSTFSSKLYPFLAISLGPSVLDCELQKNLQLYRRRGEFYDEDIIPVLPGTSLIRCSDSMNEKICLSWLTWCQ